MTALANGSARDELRRSYELLTKQHERLLDQVRQRRTASEEVGDIADEGSRNSEVEQEDTLLQEQRRHLERWAGARQRVAAGTYGKCDDCGVAIPAARLRILPSATRCIACQQRNERRR
jgi:RNA polymerase-binding transcription factor